MATWFIVSTVDLTVQNLQNITVIDFFAGATATATLNASQFSAAGVVSNVLWDGGPGSYGIVVNNAVALDASQWQFTGWKATDLITLNGTAGADKNFGSSQRDVLNGGDGADVLVGMGGIDTVNGGSGDDVLRIALGEVLAGEVYDGGTDTGVGLRDRIELKGATGTFDFTGVTLTGIESITTTASLNETVVLTNAQFGNLTTVQLGTGSDTLTVNLGLGLTMDLTAKTLSLTGIETLNLIGGGNVGGTIGGTIAMTGAQFNLFSAMTLSGTASSLILTSTASRLATIADSALTGVSSIKLAATTAGEVLDISAQSEGFTLVSSALAETLRGGLGNDQIWGQGGADSLAGAAGNDNFWLVGNTSFAGLRIDGGTDTGTAGRDTLRLFNGGTYDLTGVTLTGVESIRGDTIDPRNDVVRLTLAQYLGMTNINTEAGTDLVEVMVTGASGVVDITATPLAFLAGIETLQLTSTSPSVTFQMTGAQFSAFNKFSLAAGDVLSLTSGMAALSNLSDAALTGTSVLTFANAAAGAFGNLANQSESFDITGSAGNDTLAGGAGSDTIRGGLGGDVLTGNGGDDSFIYTAIAQLGAGEAVDGGSDSGAGLRDRIQISGTEAGLGYDFRNTSLTGIETILGTTGIINHILQLGAAQYAALSRIDLGDGIDTLSVTFSGAQSLGASAMTLAGIEAVTLRSADAASVLTLSGAQANSFMAFDLSVGGKLNLTSTSSAINGAADSALLGGTLQASTLSAEAAAAGVAISLILQSEGFALIGSAQNDTLLGGGGADLITGGAGADSLAGNGGNDIFAVAVGDVAAGDVIDGGLDTGTGDRDAILLTTVAGVYDLRGLTFTGVETLRTQAGATNESLSLSFAQAASLGTIDLGGGTGDSITLFALGDLQGVAIPVFQNVEQAVLRVDGGDATLTGGQVDRFSQISLSPGLTLNLTSTSAGLNLMADAALTGARFSAAAATSGVTLDLSRQSEALVLTGGSGNDTLIGGGGNDQISGGGGLDSLVGNGGDDVFSLAAADLLSGESISGGTDSGAGYRDTLLLTTRVGTYDFRGTILTGIETLRADPTPGDYNIVMTFAQVAGLSLIELTAANVDRLTMVGSGDVAGLTFATINGLEGVHMELTGDAALTGGQVDRFNRISFAPETTLTLTSTSAGLNLMGDFSVFGSRFSAAAATSGVTIDLSRQSEALTLTGSAQGDVLRGGASDDTITGGGGADSLYGNGGDDVFLVALSEATVGEVIDGGTDSGTGDRDKIVLNTLGGIFDLTGVSFTGVETLTVSNPGNSGETVTISLGQFASFSTIALGAGTDELTVRHASTTPLDITAQSFATRQGVERTVLDISGGNVRLTMTGAQADTFDAISFGGAPNTLGLKSTSVGLNAMSDATFQAGLNLTITGASATSGLLLDLSQQSEGMSLVGGSGADTIRGGQGVDTITVGANDAVFGNGGVDRFFVSSGALGTASFDGGTDLSGSVDRISIGLGQYNFSGLSITGIEGIDVQPVNFGSADNVTISSAQFATIGTIDLSAGIDKLTVLFQAGTQTLDVTAQSFATLIGVEQVVLNLAAPVGELRMTGAQADLFTSMAFAGDPQLLMLTSTSARVNGYADTQLTGLTRIYATAAASGVTIDISQQSEAFLDLTGSAHNDMLTGSGGENVIIGGGGADILSGGGGLDTFQLAAGDFAAGEQIDGGSGGDAITLMDKSNFDLSLGTITGVETLLNSAAASALVQTVTISLAQLDSFQQIDLQNRTDSLSVLVGAGAVDWSGASFATLSGAQQVKLVFAPLVAQVSLTGAQANLFNAIDFDPTGAPNADHVLALNSTSLGLNAMSDAALQGGGTVSAAAASGSVTIDLNLQAESFRLIGGGFADQLLGGAGNDALVGGGGADTLDGGGGGDDTLDYQASNAKVVIDLANGTASGGHAAGDVIANVENILGTAFADVLTGSSAVNRIDGGAGRDVILGGGGADILSGGVGATDVVSYVGSLSGVNVDLSRVLQTGGDAEGDQITGFESVTGSANADQLTGTTAKNTLAGGNGADVLSGGAGADSLQGGRDNDTLEGGSGADVLSGDAGADTFVLSILGGDTITDFVSGSDVLRVSASAFKGGLAAGALDASLFLASGLGQATDGLQRFVYDTATGELFFDADGNGAGLQQMIATLTNAGPLLASDFLIV